MAHKYNHPPTNPHLQLGPRPQNVFETLAQTRHKRTGSSRSPHQASRWMMQEQWDNMTMTRPKISGQLVH